MAAGSAPTVGASADCQLTRFDARLFFGVVTGRHRIRFSYQGRNSRGNLMGVSEELKTVHANVMPAEATKKRRAQAKRLAKGPATENGIRLHGYRSVAETHRKCNFATVGE